MLEKRRTEQAENTRRFKEAMAAERKLHREAEKRQAEQAFQDWLQRIERETAGDAVSAAAPAAAPPARVARAPQVELFADGSPMFSAPAVRARSPGADSLDSLDSRPSSADTLSPTPRRELQGLLFIKDLTSLFLFLLLFFAAYPQGVCWRRIRGRAERIRGQASRRRAPGPCLRQAGSRRTTLKTMRGSSAASRLLIAWIWM